MGGRLDGVRRRGASSLPQEQQAVNAHVRQRVLRALIVVGYQHAQRPQKRRALSLVLAAAAGAGDAHGHVCSSAKSMMQFIWETRCTLIRTRSCSLPPPVRTIATPHAGASNTPTWSPLPTRLTPSQQ